MYVCGTGGCAQTAGYIKINGYSLLTSAPSSWSSTYNAYFKKENNGSFSSVSGVDDESGGITEPVYTANTYYEKIDYCKVNADGSGADITSDATSLASCSTDAGALSSADGLCLGNSLKLAFSGGEALLSSAASNTLFESYTASASVLVAANANTIYFNNAPSSKYFYLFIYFM